MKAHIEQNDVTGYSVLLLKAHGNVVTIYHIYSTVLREKKLKQTTMNVYFWNLDLVQRHVFFKHQRNIKGCDKCDEVKIIPCSF